MVPRGLRVTQTTHFPLLPHVKQLLSVTFCDAIAGIGASLHTDGNMETQLHGTTDEYINVEVEIVI